MRSNTETTYGAVAKFFHWSIALLIIAMIPLGIYANDLPYDTGEALAEKAWYFSLHKTIGVTIFFLALARIAWAIAQPKPGQLNADKPVEAGLAALAHWLLYASLVLVPLSGWIHHAATTGFAPIWWPFGQDLPLVPKDDGLAHTFKSLHIIFERVLVITLLAHIAGALKHHIIDRDLTLVRMLPGKPPFIRLPEQNHPSWPIFGAVAVFAVALSTGAALGLFKHSADTPAVPTLAAVESEWQVQDGTLGLTVQQLGSAVSGSFEDWTAAINFSEEPNAEGTHGDVEVQIAIGSLTLGSVTSQAMGPDFFAAEAHPTAVFKADLLPDGENYVAEGTLTVKGNTQPVTLPFTLQIDGDTAAMQGQTTLNRTNYNVGETYPDESSLGFDVNIEVNLTATR
ncbi:cytochrome b561 [Litoreibacter ponti]|uniref:Cytochrome b561 n=1 Tax=Litoreibacter ponti TaxID=1510457 RepID=A0A2T6BJK3_9RHOB|nr:cytochrome b/b6 domain-containing protein [Litoreibacter ponti]PTX56247.1 cytochrome b561 [Litoreibacter ponti]